ncbi:ABC transporter permease [Mycobacterium seoulense]|uniref:ABC transporter permease n=1 Tax=Mycobacterium seoulense TaxID=386911 RepID=UPI003CF83A58
MITQSLPQHGRPARPRPPLPLFHATGLVAAMTVAVAVICIAFALPAARSKPHHIPIGLVGPGLVTGLINSQLDTAAPGGFTVTTYPDEAALRSAIRNRDGYGGLVVTPTGPTLLLASGASPTVAQLLTQIGDRVAQRTGAPLRTEDLAPLPADDPRGAGLAASALPITLAGILPAIVLLLAFPRRPWLNCAVATAFSVSAAVTIAVLLRYVLGSVDQNFWGVAAGLTLGTLAMALPTLALGSLFGRAGLSAAVAVAMLLGNPLSGLMSAPEMLPSGWGALGQLLPQGANATLLRSTAYFSGAGATTASLVLCCWVAAAAVLIGIAGARRA